MEIDKNKLKSFNENGYIHLKGYLDKELLDQIRNGCKRIFGKQLASHGYVCDLENDLDFEKALYKLFKEDYAAFIGAAKLCQHQIELNQIAISEKVMNVVKGVGVNYPAICVKPIVHFNSRHIAKEEGHYKTPPHQDWRSMQGSINSVVVWIPLIDIDVSLGALDVIPKSHVHGIYETKKDEWFRTIDDPRYNEDEFVVLEVEKGDLVCFNAFLIHRSGNNVTENIRWSMHFRYNDINEPTFIDRKYPHPYVVYRPDQDILFPEFNEEQELRRYLNGN
jgi:phytanoyl-CoA hydroxylase